MKKALRRKPLKRWMFKKILNWTREFMRANENIRYEHTRSLGIARELFRIIGQRFQEENVLEFDRDIFFLSKEEIFLYIEGRSVTTDIKSLVAVRKEEYERFKKMPEPSTRIETYGVVYQSNDFYNQSPVGTSVDHLIGTGSCAGIVQAKVRVVQQPEEFEPLDGEILVAANADSRYLPFLSGAAGIILQHGHVLSHLSIVCREMNIPCIVGVAGLMDQVKTGEWIEMNGSTGEVKRMKEPEKKH